VEKNFQRRNIGDMSSFRLDSDDHLQKKVICKLENILNPRSVLEVGCGIGRLKKCFEYSDYIGLDNNREALKIIPRWGLNKVLASGKKLPLVRAFDLVFTCTVLMHQERISEFLKEMVRVTDKWLVILEAYKKLPFAYLHDYEKSLGRFNLLLREVHYLDRKKSPLALWLFEK